MVAVQRAFELPTEQRPRIVETRGKVGTEVPIKIRAEANEIPIRVSVGGN